MHTKIFSIIIIACNVFGSCNPTSKNTSNNEQSSSPEPKTSEPAEQDIPYTIADRYFVNNTYKDGDLKNPKITAMEKFDELFGMATIMGPNGKPTPIDFSRQYALSVIGEISDRGAEISPVSLKQRADTIFFSYKITEGEKRMTQIRPMLLIIVDNKYQGEVKLVEVSS